MPRHEPEVCNIKFCDRPVDVKGDFLCRKHWAEASNKSQVVSHRNECNFKQMWRENGEFLGLDPEHRLQTMEDKLIAMRTAVLVEQSKHEYPGGLLDCVPPWALQDINVPSANKTECVGPVTSIRCYACGERFGDHDNAGIKFRCLKTMAEKGWEKNERIMKEKLFEHLNRRLHSYAAADEQRRHPRSKTTPPSARILGQPYQPRPQKATARKSTGIGAGSRVDSDPDNE